MATFTNRASLSYNNMRTNSNLVVGEITETLTAEKTALTASYGADATITYIITLTNEGNAPFTDLTLSDTLGVYTASDQSVYPLGYVADSIRYFVNGAPQTAPTVSDSSPLEITGISVPANGNAMLIYETRTTEFAPLGLNGSITNTATISGTGVTTPITVSETVTAQNAARLSISKSVNPTSVIENEDLTYTFVIMNTGNSPATAADNAQITDILLPPLSNITVRFNDTEWSDPTNYTYNESTGVFTTVAGQITVPAATFSQDTTTGAQITTPGISVLQITGTL